MLTVGDLVFIKENIIDERIRQLYDKPNAARKWESYRNRVFTVIGIDDQNLIIIQDINGNEIHISRRALEEV